MNVREPEAFARYLAAKRTVDDRALNRVVLETFRRELETLGSSLRIVDVGAGIGIGLERLVEWELLSGPDRIEYVRVDPNPENIAAARRRLAGLAPWLDVRFETAAVEAFAAAHDGEPFDVLIAHALLDLLDLERVLPRMLGLVRSGGLVYFPITFDGLTAFEPAHPRDRDVLERYHATMDAREGGSRAGRALFAALRRNRVDLLAVGSSDWVVHAPRGAYPADEKYFVQFIVETVAGAVSSMWNEAEALEAWRTTRRRQIEAGELVYLAHQLDFVARKPT